MEELLGLTTLDIILTAIIGVLLAVIRVIIRHNEKTITAQNETIQKLINREPVTYKEVNAKPPTPDTDRPIAWAGSIANRDEL